MSSFHIHCDEQSHLREGSIWTFYAYIYFQNSVMMSIFRILSDWQYVLCIYIVLREGSIWKFYAYIGCQNGAYNVDCKNSLTMFSIHILCDEPSHLRKGSIWTFMRTSLVRIVLMMSLTICLIHIHCDKHKHLREGSIWTFYAYIYCQNSTCVCFKNYMTMYMCSMHCDKYPHWRESSIWQKYTYIYC